MACSAVLLKPHVSQIYFSQFCPKEVFHHASVALRINGDRISLIVFKEVWTNHSSPPKSTPNIDFFGILSCFLKFLCIFITPITSVLFIHILIHLQMGLISEDYELRKFRIFTQLLEAPINKTTSHFVVHWLQTLG